MNAKVRLLALKCMLSAKLFEEKIVFIDSEALEMPKTQLLETIISPFKKDKLCFLTSKSVDENFSLAAQNLQLVKTKIPQEFHVPDLLNNDYVFITKQGLVELE
jgi:large subunit ribosomal protein L4